MASGTFKHLSPTLNSSLIASSACQKQQEQIRLDIIAAAATGTCFGRRNNSIRTTLLRKGLPHTTTSYQDPEANVTTCRREKKKRSSFQLLHSSGGLPPQKCTFSPGSLPPQKKRLRRFSFQLTHSSGNLPPQKTTEGVACKCRIFIWEPATAKTSRISSLQLSHFHLGACHRKKKVKKVLFSTATLI